MSTMFAAVDQAGVTRFVGDVPRGAACGCICPACGSALVARCGDERQWHFAHVARQERPECLAGSLNLLRRIAIEWLQAQPALRLPTYSESVSPPYPLPQLVEVVSWDGQPRRVYDWRPQAPHREAVARIEMASSAPVDLHVGVGGHSSGGSLQTSSVGRIDFWVPAPQPGQLRHGEDALRHVAIHGFYSWVYQPDVHGLIARAREALGARAQRAQQDAQILRAREAERQRLRQAPAHGAAPVVPAAPSPWDAWRKPHSSFIYRCNAAGEGWLQMRHRDQHAVLMPWPQAWDAWDEFFPRRMAHVDAALGALVLDEEIEAVLLLQQHFGVSVRICSSFDEVLALHRGRAAGGAVG